MESSLHKFQELLKEIFQFDSADLDFGVYRILNHKRELIEKFINEDLKEKSEDFFEGLQKENIDKLNEELAKAKQAVIDSINPDVFTPSGDIKEEYRDFKACKDYIKILEQKKDTSNVESIKAQTFNDLYNFFSRYYSQGDFVPQYRHSIKGNRYAIPYNGEEVKLYWANSDQYYTKTGLLFKDYAFFADSAREFKIVFRTVEAREELSSNKATKQRFFIVDDQLPLKDQENGIFVHFHYRELTEEEVRKYNVGGGAITSKQEKLNDESAKIIISKTKDTKLKGFLSKEYINERNLLQNHINRYTAKNTRDYFIHKNLKKFLSEQLDYFIKSEVFSLETIEEEKNLVRHLARAKVVRQIGEDIISFLAQLEDFQKKLWEKKKFVLRTEYVITSDQIPSNFYDEILANQKQKKEWQLLGLKPPSSKKKLSSSFYPVDTKHFNADFKGKLLEKLTEKADLDDLLDGLLINSENWQALNLLQDKYQEKVDCIHIDPPYNTDTSGFLYKNNYKHSSWLTMIYNNILLSIRTMAKDASFLCHIDENEYEYLSNIFNNTELTNLGTIIWDKRNPMTGGKGLATQHEYVIWRSKSNITVKLKYTNVDEMLQHVNMLIDKHGEVNEDVRKKYSEWINKNDKLTGGEKAYRYIDDEGNVYRAVSLRAPEPRYDEKFHIPLIHPVTKKPCAIPPNGFSRTPETLAKMIENKEILFGEDETTQPNQKRFLSSDSTRQMTTILQDGRKGKKDTDLLGLYFPYCHPVSLYVTLLGSATNKLYSWTTDSFAGSGTTGHAVMKLNHEDGGNRKYILIEMANYFETVLIPRLKKVSYSFNWSDGKPKDTDGISQFIKYQYLEQYEDALDNLELSSNEDAQQLFKDDYLLKYFLDYETRGNATLLNIESLRKPFSYRLKVNFEEVGEPEEMVVDIPETFNYLLGLKVKKIKYRVYKEIKYMFILGEKNSRDIAVVWRDYSDDWDSKLLKEDKSIITENLLPWKPHEVYVNGQSVLTSKLGDTKIEVRYIESEYKKLMG